MCRTGQFNLSYESLTSFNARETLRNLKTMNPEFWAELTPTQIESIRKRQHRQADQLNETRAYPACNCPYPQV